MPRVNIEHVVSFSSEDPEYSAAGLVKAAAGGKGWRVGRGEVRGAVVLQLARAVRVASITLGAVNAATVEVLVGRAEAPDHYEVLVPTCMLLSPAESRRAGADGVDGARVRSFTDSTLTAAGARCWDRVRLVLAQPYNKHVQFGVSFVQVYEPEVPASAAACPLPLELNADSDDEVFRPGELFAQRMQTADSASEGKTTSTDTDAQIRQATSRVLKHIDISGTKLKRASINKPAGQTDTQTRDDRSPASSGRQRDTPHLKTHTNDSTHDKRHNKASTKRDRSQSEPDKSNRSNDEPETKRNKRGVTDTRRDNDDKHLKHESSMSDIDKHRNKSHTEHKQSKDERNASHRGRSRNSNVNNSSGGWDGRSSNSDRARGGDSGGMLRGVVFVLSGYEHPRRGSVRRLAETHGALARRDWGPGCTHLICAFPNTPKMRLVRSGGGDGGARVVTAEWVEASVAAGRALPWRWFATDPTERRTPPTHLSAAGRDHSDQDQVSECDTDDEIEQVIRNKTKDSTPQRNTNGTDDKDQTNGVDDIDSVTSHRQRSDADDTILHTDMDGSDTVAADALYNTKPAETDDRAHKQSYSDMDCDAYNAHTRPCSPAEPACVRRALPLHPALGGQAVGGRALAAGHASALRRALHAHGALYCEEVDGVSEPQWWVSGEWMETHYRSPRRADTA